MYKGTIVENSLADKSILQELQIVGTRRAGDWVLHDVLVDASKVADISGYLDSGPWYVHLWQPGKDGVKVIFRNAIFEISRSDRSTWTDAIAHGRSIGIPERQLDFVVD